LTKLIELYCEHNVYKSLLRKQRIRLSREYLHRRTKNLNKPVKNTGFFCFKDLPVNKTLIYSNCSNWLPFTKANVFTDTVYKCIDTLLQNVYDSRKVPKTHQPITLVNNLKHTDMK
jgi:hypothetical protein